MEVRNHVRFQYTHGARAIRATGGGEPVSGRVGTAHCFSSHAAEEA